MTLASIYINEVDRVEEDELLDLLELEVRDLLSNCGYPGFKIPVIRGSALTALESDNIDSEEMRPILKLLEVIDSYIPTPSAQISQR